MAELRCPFCHEACAGDDPLRLACAACDAPHHAPCFVEGRGCAATGCRSSAARVGAHTVLLEQLLARAEDPAALERLRALPPPGSRGRWALLAAAAVLPLALGLLSLELGALPWPVWAGALLVAGLFLALALRPAGEGQERPRVVLRDEPEASFDPIFGAMNPTGFAPGVLPDPSAGVRAKLERQPLLPESAPLAPERCPSCQGRLREPEERPFPLAFCFHCGLGLGPEPSRAPEGELEPGEEPPEKAPGKAPPPRDRQRGD